MSRLYFHTQTQTAEIMGSERGWLRYIAANAAGAWWGLNGIDPLDRALDITRMIVPGSNAEYVRTSIIDQDRFLSAPETSNHTTLIKDYAQQAIDDRSRFQEAWKQHTITGDDPIRNVRYDRSKGNKLIDVLNTCLRVTNIPLKVGEHVVFSANVEFNTALATGNHAVCLAAKIHGWCEIHPWFEERDRGFFADLIEDAVQDGVYRDGLWYDDADGNRVWQTQGWDNVVSLLRDTTTHPGPVVLASSVCDDFPNSTVSTQMPPWPAGVPERWDALNEEQKEERSDAHRAWYDLPSDQRWETAMDGIRSSQPWAHIAPENLTTTTFGPNVTLFDLFHHDRVGRIQVAFDRDREAEEAEEENRVQRPA